MQRNRTLSVKCKIYVFPNRKWDDACVQRRWFSQAPGVRECGCVYVRLCVFLLGLLAGSAVCSMLKTFMRTWRALC